MNLSISVVMATYNGSRFVEKQLESIRGQTLLPDEVLIGDDGSVDGTQELVRQFAKRSGLNVRLYENTTRLGASQNFAVMAGRAVGDIIVFSDQDDVWMPKKLERMSNAFSADPEVGYVFSDAEVVDEHDNPLGYRLWKSLFFGSEEQSMMRTGHGLKVLLKRNVVTGATMAVRGRFKDRFLPIPGSWMHDGWIALILSTVSRGYAISEPLVAYRSHGHQQIGAVGPSLKSAWKFARRQGASFLSEEAKNYELAEKRLLALGVDCADRSIWLLGRKAAFMKQRARIKAGGVANIPAAFFQLFAGKYGRYGLGAKQLCLDLISADPALPRT